MENTENLNAVNDAQQTAVESAQDSSVISGTEQGTPERSANAGAAPRTQNKSENRSYAQLRREKESAAATVSQLISGLNALGLEGNTPEALLEQLEAKNAKVSVEELRRQKSEAAAAVRNNPEYKDLENRVMEFGKKEDLRELQSIDPRLSSLDELGEDFVRLRAAGIAAKTAYFAVKQSAAPKTQKPQSIGAVNDGGGAESEYFTSEQLDRLTKKDLENPKIYEKAIRSMSHLN